MILCIDTFSDNFSVSLLSPNMKVIGCIDLLKPKPFSEILLTEIDQLLKKLSIRKTEVSKVVVNKGPGSNTGLRVGAITGKTISYTLSVPLYSYVSLDAIAYGYRHFHGKVIPCINVGKGMVAYKVFEKSKEVQSLTFEEIDSFKDRYLLKEDILIVEKNLNLQAKNSIPPLVPLSILGGIYAVENDLLEDTFLFEPIYHS
ncbi:MAG: tRNA (adenosine(37)-N6)-threonylcarbamoyltransferase complex dimerization subunit type 1 TsaB [Hydrogenothermaceae bacterium]|nr:tRNA (adenosine(37)-N6)-threonylcarbamoyltransferase complex dimerization subunit type 1 TsaB [Hydrogenothermaceae bacterium]